MEEGHSYLIKDGASYEFNKPVHLVIVLKVTDKCLQIKYEYAERPSWVLKHIFMNNNTIIEDLGFDFKKDRDNKISEIIGDESDSFQKLISKLDPDKISPIKDLIEILQKFDEIFSRNKKL